MLSSALVAPLAGLLLAAPAAPPSVAQSPSACAFTVLVDRSGIHKLSFEELRAAAEAEDPPVALARLPSGNLQLSHLGQTLPIWIEDGGDGLFGPGDRIEFLGEPPRGERSTYDERVRFNAYRLNGCVPAPADARQKRPAKATEPAPVRELLRVVDHLENDRLLLRFHQFGFGKDDPELWYWAKLTQIDQAPFSLPIDLRSYAAARGKIRLSLDLRGWSYGSGARVQQSDHVLELLWNGKSLGTFESSGQQRLRVDIPEVPADVVADGRNTLTLKVPARQGSDGQPIIDVMMLNWIELEFPRRRRLDADQQQIQLEPREGSSTVIVSSEEAGELLIYDDIGHRWDSRSYRRETGADGTRYLLTVPQEAGMLRTVASGAFRRPSKVEVDLPSHLSSPENQADYLMIVHPSLRRTLEPLAELHRQHGLTVQVVDVRDIYEEYSHGMRRPEAIQAFLAEVWQHWQTPRLRFVLLVGDASWDSRNEEAADENYADWTYQPGEVVQFIKNRSTPYSDAGTKSRDLIPAWTWEMHQGHAASDNYYACVEGEDYRPEFAIGRLPIVENEELQNIIDKIEKYVARLDSAEIAPWQERLLFISNQEKHFQKASDRLAAPLEERGLEVQKVYPQTTDSNNSASVDALKNAFNEGQLLVHFIGHGGRYIWRTGPEDLKRNNDLFTLQDLDSLSPTDGYPFVLSLTCYSAPFDHPTADSIGEKLLRIPDKGAIAVLAAAWRNSPPSDFSRRILEELQVPGKSIGEAVLAGKRQEKMSEDAIRQYNLLGDPALPLALPKLKEAAKPDWLQNKIRWQTASEVDNFGYDVYRGPKEEGPFAKVTQTPVPGNGTTDEPSAYEYIDDSIEEGVEYWYYVESISISGDREKFTPIFKAKVKTKPPEGG